MREQLNNRTLFLKVIYRGYSASKSLLPHLGNAWHCLMRYHVHLQILVFSERFVADVTGEQLKLRIYSTSIKTDVGGLIGDLSCYVYIFKCDYFLRIIMIGRKGWLWR